MALINCPECDKQISDKAEICVGCGAPLESKFILSNIHTIGKAVNIGNLEVAQYDFPKRMTYDDAKRACEKLGEGWELPDKDDLNILFQNISKIKGFQDYYYWSSTEYDRNSAWYQRFKFGNKNYTNKSAMYYVRAIRSF